MSANNAYIFLGPELGKKNDAIDGLREKIAKKGAGAPEEFIFYAGETQAGKIANAIQNHSLFAQARMFLIKNADQIKKKDEIALISSCAGELDDDTTLVLISDEIRLASGLDQCCPPKNRVVYYEMFEGQKIEWVQSFFRQQGRSVSRAGVEAILELVENNTDALRRECARLALFLPKDRQVEAQDVEEWLSHNREESAFTLFSRIAAADAPKAIETLRALLAAKESPQGILAGLAWCFKKLRDYIALAKNGNAENSFELKKIGLSSPKAKSDYVAASKIYGAQAVDSCLALTAEYDALTRSSGGALEAILMDMYVIKILSASKGKAF
ncbi:MAG: DNA polymerase III subunit delta [Treponema sp.]|nr:DNA polymerase III subunit delta [Treponema sp.]